MWSASDNALEWPDSRAGRHSDAADPTSSARLVLDGERRIMAQLRDEVQSQALLHHLTSVSSLSYTTARLFSPFFILLAKVLDVKGNSVGYSEGRFI